MELLLLNNVKNIDNFLWNNLDNLIFLFFATVAQLVEQFIRNERVGGSSPLGGSTGEMIDAAYN